MSGSSTPVDALVAALRRLRDTERLWPAMAADPQGRARLTEALTRVDAELEGMRRVVKEATRTHDALAKVLKRVRPRILA